jgi:hypothetical protein
MAKTFLENLSQAAYVKYGYAQVEPNHLSAQRTGQIYAQLPADAGINVLENGQFVKYDYAKGLVNFTGEGEWMLVFNEIKLYREGQDDCEFAMIKRNYNARVYSPSTGVLTDEAQSRNYKDVVAPADPYSYDATEDPFHIYNQNEVALMPKDTTMVPRVLKTNVGDIFTTNCIAVAEPAVGNVLAPNASGILDTAAEDAAMKWQVVKVYTMPDGQPGVKIMRIA